VRLTHVVIGGDIAGGQIVALQLARAARGAGHDVRFISPSEGPFLVLARSNGFDVAIVQITGALDIAAIRRLSRELHDTDLVHTHGHFAVNTVARIAARIAGARVVSHMHIENSFRGGFARHAQIALDNFTARLCSAIIAVSEATRRSLILQGYPADRVLTVHNGISLDVAPVSPRRLAHGRVVIEVGRLAEVKGQRTLLEALIHLDASIVLVGSDLEQGGEYERALRAYAEELGVANRVVFAGHRDDVAELLEGSDVLCLPSSAEGLPMVILEAMVRGRPVVATAVGGTPELVLDGQTGLLVQPRDPVALAAALSEILDDTAYARRLGEAGRARVRESFSAEGMSKRVLTVYERARVESKDSQVAVRRWWAENPMTYDWRGEIPYEFGSADYLAEVERRFLAETWFAQTLGARPFASLIPYDHLAGKDVLEVGCGTGVHTRLIAEAGARVTAIDLTPTAVELTKRRLELAGQTATVLEADAESMPFADRSFDFVWSWGVVHHSTNTERAIAETARVLRPDGLLACMVYHRTSLTYWLNYVLYRGIIRGGLLRETPEELANRWSDGVIARHYTRGGLIELLRPWFEDIETQVMGQIGEAIPLPSRLRLPVARLIPRREQERLLRRLGWFLFATARRKA
jgi:glycosyltransferase involved in cell wall biosynthesis/ubiquinone/menaquinone biosynthesis C-methylase UbiE